MDNPAVCSNHLYLDLYRLYACQCRAATDAHTHSDLYAITDL